MASSKREKELARMRAERQAARRAAAAARRRQRNAVIASVVAVALIAAGAIVLATKLSGRDTEEALPGPSESATASPKASRKPGTCEYKKSTEPAAREVLFPPIEGVETTQVFTVSGAAPMVTVVSVTGGSISGPTPYFTAVPATWWPSRTTSMRNVTGSPG